MVETQFCIHESWSFKPNQLDFEVETRLEIEIYWRHRKSDEIHFFIFQTAESHMFWICGISGMHFERSNLKFRPVALPYYILRLIAVVDIFHWRWKNGGVDRENLQKIKKNTFLRFLGLVPGRFWVGFLLQILPKWLPSRSRMIPRHPPNAVEHPPL